MAEVVAGLLTSAVVKIACDKLGSAIAEQTNLGLNFNGDLEDMKETMESMAAVFEDAEKQSVKKRSVPLWLKRLKYASFDITDMMEDDYRDTGSTSKMLGILSCFTTALKKIVLANKMKNMRDKLRKIDEQRQRFNFTPSTAASEDHINQGLKINERETTSHVNEEKILGREGEKKEIINTLSARGRKDGTMVLPIYGLGGIGKSTLAQLVYNETQLKYELRVWVYVSEVFDLKKIGNSIISQISTDGGHQNLDTLQMITQRLDKLLLSGKKILIILDDIWEEDASELDKLQDMLQVIKNGSMVDVLVTTRS